MRSYRVGALEIDYKKLRVLLDGQDVHLTPNEFKIVALLGKHAGRVMTYKSILRQLWGPSASMDNKILRVHMASIRRKIEPDPDQAALYLHRSRRRLPYGGGGRRRRDKNARFVKIGRLFFAAFRFFVVFPSFLR